MTGRADPLLDVRETCRVVRILIRLRGSAKGRLPVSTRVVLISSYAALTDVTECGTDAVGFGLG